MQVQQGKVRFTAPKEPTAMEHAGAGMHVGRVFPTVTVTAAALWFMVQALGNREPGLVAIVKASLLP